MEEQRFGISIQCNGGRGIRERRRSHREEEKEERDHIFNTKIATNERDTVEDMTGVPTGGHG